MIKIYKSFKLSDEIANIQDKCWINVIDPNQLEIQKLVNKFNLPYDSIQDILDTDEMPRIEIDEDYTLVIIRVPLETLENGVPYITIPLGIFIKDEYTITICSKRIDIFSFKRKIYPTNSYDFILSLFIRSSFMYLKYLKQINIKTTEIERDIEKSIKNKELSELLKMEKCLVYFITSIKSNEIVLLRLKNTKKYDEDLMEEAMIESKQAQEMAEIYSNILSGMMDAFASVISNNLNVIMKQLTLMSIILMIPTLIASYFGMNIHNYLESYENAFPFIVLLSFLISIIAILFIRKRKLY